MPKYVWALALIATTLLGAGCEEVKLPQKRAPAKVACDVFTQQEASAALGAPAEKGQVNQNEEGDVTVTTCAYSTSGTPLKAITLLLRRAENEKEALSGYEQAKVISQDQSGVAPVDITGLGDKAYWAGGNLRQLNVLSGDYWIILSAFGLEGDMQAKMETTVGSILSDL